MVQSKEEVLIRSNVPSLDSMMDDLWVLLLMVIRNKDLHHIFSISTSGALLLALRVDVLHSHTSYILLTYREDLCNFFARCSKVL